MNDTFRRLTCLTLSFVCALCALVFCTGCILRQLTTQNALREMLAGAELAAAAAALTGDPVLTAAAADDAVEAWVRDYAAAVLSSAVRSMPEPEPDLPALNQAIDSAIRRLGAQYGLTGYAAGLRAASDGAQESAALLFGTVQMLHGASGMFLPGGAAQQAAGLLTAPAALAGAAAAFCLLTFLLFRLAPQVQRTLWCCIPLFLCGGVCLFLGQTTGGGTSGIAARWAARLGDLYVRTGYLCFVLCAIFFFACTAFQLRTAARNARC